MKTVMRYATIVMSVVVFPWIFFNPTSLKAQKLDNQTFTIQMNEINKPESVQEDLLMFSEGQLDSKECRQYGFSPSPYTTSHTKDKITFSAVCTSDIEGEMIWKGTVIANQIDGKVLWKKEGQKDIEYSFKGKLKKDKTVN